MEKMQIGRWGNSLAVRLPKELVDRYQLREGGEIDSAGIDQVRADAEQQARERRRAEALEEIRRIRDSASALPADWRFDREHAHWRPAIDRW